MRNPFLVKMPATLDAKIRWRIFRAKQKPRARVWPLFFSGVVAVTTVVCILAVTMTPFYPDGFVAEVQAAQLNEQTLATTDIYHLKWTITEGADKARYVQTHFPGIGTTTPRSDRIETFQHNENRLTQIRSNDSAFGFEVFLSATATDRVTLYHYGEEERQRSLSRSGYDAAHDIRSLYQSFTNLDAAVVPTLPPEATFSNLDTSTDIALFTSSPSRGVTVHHFVDTKTKLLRRQVIYLTDEYQHTYEMALITFNERSIIPAKALATIFAVDTYDFSIIERKALPLLPVSLRGQNRALALAR